MLLAHVLGLKSERRSVLVWESSTGKDSVSVKVTVWKLGVVLVCGKAVGWAFQWATESDRKSQLVWETSTGQVWARAWAERLVVLLEEELVRRQGLELEPMDEGWD
jgi:hypothetical protein